MIDLFQGLRHIFFALNMKAMLMQKVPAGKNRQRPPISQKIGKQGYPISKHKRAMKLKTLTRGLRGEIKWRWDKAGSNYLK